MRISTRCWLEIGLCLGLTSMVTACEDEEELKSATFGVWNLSSHEIIWVEWNADPSTITSLGYEFFTTVGTVRRLGGDAPAIKDTPLWCLRVRTSPGSGTLFESSRVPRRNYEDADDLSNGKLYLLRIDDAFLDLQHADDCMSVGGH